MAITYTISQCKKGYGIYIKALSGLELDILRHRLPEIEGTKGNYTLFGKPLTGAVAVYSDRITRKKTLPQAKQALKRIKALPGEAQIELVRKRYLKPIEKDFKILKLQYNRFNWKFGDSWISPFTTQDIESAEKLAMSYAMDGTPVKLIPTIAKNKKLTYAGAEKASAKGHVKVETPKGLKGMMKHFKDQGPEMLNRISQRRKRTTTNEFFQRYR